MIPKHAKELLDEIKNLGYKPKGKEVGFLKSVRGYIQRDLRLTPPMTTWLNDIYRRAAGGGDYQEIMIKTGENKKENFKATSTRV